MQDHITRRHRHFLTRLVLAFLVFGAYIPAGFMPASGAPFALELCPAASPLPAAMPMTMPGHHHHHSASHISAQPCPFGTAPGAGPVPLADLFTSPAPIAAPTLSFTSSATPDVRLDRAHRQRGPPFLA